MRVFWKAFFYFSVPIVFFCITPRVFAEYYLVYPGPAPVVSVYSSHRASYHRYTHVRYHRIYRPSSYHISVYYICNAYPPCPCARGGEWAQAYPVETRYWTGHPVRDRYGLWYGPYPENEVNDRYDPDLSTGDDDAADHPDMQIN